MKRRGKFARTIGERDGGHEHGAGWFGYSGDGWPENDASLNEALGLCVGPDGDVYIADAEDNSVRP